MCGRNLEVGVSILMGWMRKLRVGAGAKGGWGYDFDSVRPEA
jgi:hypothetical protein